MKNIFTFLLLLACISLSNLVFSQTVIWSDDFSTAGNWASSDNNGTNHAWSFTSVAPLGTYSAQMGIINSTTHANKFALFDSDYQCDETNGQVVSLLANYYFDFTNYTNVSIQFQQYYRKWVDATYVMLTVDGGANWSYIELNSTLTQSQYSANPTYENIDISNYVDGESQVYLGFLFYSPTTAGEGAGCGYAWMIDDFKILGNINGTAPTPNFTSDGTTINEGQTVNFTDLSTDNPDTWYWEFPGGTPSTSSDQNPSIVYNTAGIYDVSLTVSNSFGSNGGTATEYITVNPNSNTTNLISDLGNGFFIEGVNDVLNNFIATSSATGVTNAAFFLKDSTDVDIIPYVMGTQSGSTWTASIDMGLAQKGSYVIVGFFDDLDNLLDNTDPYTLNIISKPAWLNSYYQGQITNVNVDYGQKNISMHGQLPLDYFLNTNQSVSSVIGLSGKSFKLFNPNLDFDILFDIETGVTDNTQATLNSDFNALSSTNTPISNTSFNSTLSFDTDFNLTFNGTALWEPPTISNSYEFKNVPLLGANVGIASVGALCVNTSLSFSFQPKIKAQIFAGYDATTQQWGFKHNGADITQLLGKINAAATAKGELKAVCGSFLGLNFGFGTMARGEVRATLTLGGGIQYANIPSSEYYSPWAYDFKIEAYGEVAGFGDKSGSYEKQWGDTSAIDYKVITTTNDFFKSSTYKFLTFPTPNAWPMGVISTRDSILASAWLDDINFSGNTALLTACYNPQLNSFSTPILVAINDSGMTNQSISLLPNKDILISWAQLSIPRSEIDTSIMTIDDISKKQDIWIALIRPSTNTIIYRGKLTDNNNNRADGEPRIHWGNNNQGMITWQGGNNTYSGSDVYYSVIEDNGNGTYGLYAPQILSNTFGFNYNISVNYTTGNNAIATWFNDPDMNPETNNSDIYFSVWDGIGNWSTPDLRFAVAPGLEIKDHSMATNGLYGIEGLTYQYYTLDSTLINGVYLGQWSNGNAVINDVVQQYEDVTSIYQLPRVSVSQSGVASLTIQIRDILDPNDNGNLNLFMKDLNYASNEWDNVAITNPSYLSFISDPNQFVWDMSSKYGYLQSANSSDIMYLFTQEMDTLGNTNPTHGAIFGNPNLNLVLRAFLVNNSSGNLTLSDVPEPVLTSVNEYYQKIKPFNYNFELKNCYPNPFNDETNIPFHINKSGRVLIELFDMNSKYLGTILDSELLPGDYQTKFTRGHLESGIYFYRFTSNGQSTMRKMIITK